MFVAERSRRQDGNMEAEFGSSEYAKEVLGEIWGVPPALDLKQEAALQKCVRELIQGASIESAHDCSDGGLAVALAEAVCEVQPRGSVLTSARRLTLSPMESSRKAFYLAKKPAGW